jgi:hypothetical protein
MMRITISVPGDLAEAVRREARRRGLTVSEVARQALRARLGPEIGPKPGFVGLGRSGHANTARNAEQILAEEWAPGTLRGERC